MKRKALNKARMFKLTEKEQELQNVVINKLEQWAQNFKLISPNISAKKVNLKNYENKIDSDKVAKELRSKEEAKEKLNQNLYLQTPRSGTLNSRQRMPLRFMMMKMKEEETESDNESVSPTTSENRAGGKTNSKLRTTWKGEASYKSYKRIRGERNKRKLGCNSDYSVTSNQDDTELEFLVKSDVQANRTSEIMSRQQWQEKMNEALNELEEIKRDKSPIGVNDIITKLSE